VRRVTRRFGDLWSSTSRQGRGNRGRTSSNRDLSPRLSLSGCVGQLHDFTNWHRTTRQVDERLLIRNGDIFVSWSATLDAFIWDRGEAWLNQHIFRVVPKESIVDKDYLFYILKSEIAALRATEHLHGSTMKHINRGPFLAHKIRLPPLAEQRRIVAKLDALSSRSTNARDEINRVSKLVERCKQATLTRAFSGELTARWRADRPHLRIAARSGSNRQSVVGRREQLETGPSDFEPPFEIPDQWQWIKLPSLGKLDRGRSRHRPRNHPSLYGGPYPFIQTGDVRAAEGRLTSFSQTYSEAGLAQSRLWPRELYASRSQPTSRRRPS
jgi:hypothetical protein